MRKLISKIVHLKNTIRLIGFVAVFVLTALNLDQILYYASEVIKHYKQCVYITTVVGFAIGATHASVKKTTPENVFFLRFLGNPFISAIFTAITYGLMMNACFALFYIIMYDNEITSKYPIDKFTTSTAIVLLFMASIYGLGRMIWDICQPEQNEATIEKSDQINQQ